LQPRRQRRRGCRQISLLCLYTLLIAIGLLAHSVHGQRAAVNLSQKIQNRFAKSAGRGNIVEDELKIEGGNVVDTEPIDLAFEGLTLELETKSGEVRTILDGVRGRAQPGRMLAVMGPSGAGKSTLIHALVGRVKDNSKLSLYGRRYINGEPVSGDSLLPAAFIEQDVNFFPHMTVRETLHFRVELKLGSLLSKHARDTMVDGLMDQLGLTKAADTVVGDAKVRGISGGERKRLSIAVEMISSPSVIVLDEPTSGLDSTAATSLVQTLRDLADSGKTVIAVIHQPSQHVFAKFDDLLLVSEGKLMYYGELHGVRSYMESYGHPATAEMGTAEHILDCISRLPIEEETKDEMNSRMERLIYKANSNPLDLGKMPTDDNGTTEFAMVSRGGPKAGIITQFRTLFKRSFREVIRGKTTLILKTVQQISLGVIYGGIYSLGTNQASIQDRFGLLSLIAIGSANMAVASTIRSFPREKAIVSNEIASKMYRTLPYFIGKALSELPLVAVFNGIFGTIVYHLTGLSRMKGKFRRFLGLLTTHGLASEAVGLVIGAVSPSSDVALAIFPAVLVLNIIFDGKNISEENTPRLLRWIPKIGLIRWGFEGLCVNEFDQLTFDTKGPRRGPVAKFGSEALDRFGLGTNTLGDIVKAQLSITVVSWALSYIGLTLTGQKYLKMQSFKSDSD
jgi:ABC-type multidrug transport system ATPase subunit